MRELRRSIVVTGPIGNRGNAVATKDRVCILEERRNQTIPVYWFSKSFCDGISRTKSYNIETIHSAKMHSPSGIDIQIGQPHKARTYTVCRKKFDQGGKAGN